MNESQSLELNGSGIQGTPVGTFLITAKMFLMPCVLWTISGTFSNIFLIPNNIRRTRLVTLCIKQTTAIPQSQSRRNKRSPSQRSRSRPCNPLYLQGGDRGDHGHINQGCQASGHIVAINGTTPTVRSMTSTMIRRDKQQHQMLRKTHFQSLALPETEARSGNELPELIKDDESSDDDKEHRGTGKMCSEPKSSESTWDFDMCPDASSSDSNPADNEPIPNERNEHYPKYFVKEFENLDDFMTVYIRYRIAGGRMKFKEFDTGKEHYYTQFLGIELEEIGEWDLDYNNIAPCEWTMSNAKYTEWFLKAGRHPRRNAILVE